MGGSSTAKCLPSTAMLASSHCRAARTRWPGLTPFVVEYHLVEVDGGEIVLAVAAGLDDETAGFAGTQIHQLDADFFGLQTVGQGSNIQR